MFQKFIEENGLKPSVACFRAQQYKRKPTDIGGVEAPKDTPPEILVVLACAPYVMFKYEHWRARQNGGVAGKDYSPYELTRPIPNYVFAVPLMQDFVSGQPMMFEAELFFADYEPVSD